MCCYNFGKHSITIGVFCNAVGPSDAAIDGNIANAIRYNFGIPTTSKLHQDYPDIEEFRTRRWDLDGDGKFKEKIEILINGEVVHTTITDTNQDGSADLGDAGLNFYEKELELYVTNTYRGGAAGSSSVVQPDRVSEVLKPHFDQHTSLSKISSTFVILVLSFSSMSLIRVSISFLSSMHLR